MTYNCDVAIVGAGPAGFSAALALLNQSDLNVIMIEQSSLRKIRLGETIPEELFSLLDRLKLPKSRFEPDCFAPISPTQAFWGNQNSQSAQTRYSINRELFDLTLLEEAASRGVGLLPQSQLIDAKYSDESLWQLTLNHKHKGRQQVNARFVIDASGRDSGVFQQAGVQRKLLDDLSGVGTLVSLNENRPLPCSQLIESTEAGWWSVTALNARKAIVTFYTDIDLLQEKQLLQPVVWLESLRQTKHIKRFVSADSASQLRIWQRQANSSVARFDKLDRFLSVGDAALSFDPVFSMGICCAMKTSVKAATIVTRCINADAATIKQQQLSYQQDLSQQFTKYLRQRSDFYQQETRWESSVFWQRRMAA